MKRSRSAMLTILLAFTLSAPASTAKVGHVPATGERGKQEIAPDSERVRKVSLNLPVLTVQNRHSGKSVGKFSFLPMVVSMSDDRSPLRISFSDDTPNGSGATIRNSAWTAALVAALQNESPLQGVRISLDFKGDVDGPSSGAVMCLGILSALAGRAFPDDFAMTGTILPDGTVGLVGSVPEKLKAAARNTRIKRVAIPAFQRFEKVEGGNWVDLFALGKELGLELCPVESIGDAYNFLHRENVARPVIPTALSVVRESAAFETDVAEVFKTRDLALNERIAGLSSNDLKRISRDFEWARIDQRGAERRFAEGAIFDALNLISLSDAYLTASLKSWEFYLDYQNRFLSKADDAKKPPRGMEDMHKWPMERQLAFVDGFRKEVSDYCEAALGWKGVEDDKPEDEKSESEETWFGMVPEAGASDLEAQLPSIVEEAKTDGLYRHMVKQTLARADLKKALQDGDRDIHAEIDHERGKLFVLLSAKCRFPSFQGVSIPIMNAGQEVSSALELFRKAWAIADGMIESDVVDPLANNASVHKEAVREHLIGNDCRFAVYDVAKRWGTLVLSLYDDTINAGDSFGYPSYTDSNVLFMCVDLFAEAAAQVLSLDMATENAAFAVFVTDRARTSALLGMEACQKAGIPCFSSALAFQEAERSRVERSEMVTQILADYWKATMSAKALLMAFKNGRGPKQGFSGYQLSEESAAARKSSEAIFQVILNADFRPIIQSLPATWVKSLSDSAAAFAEKSNDEEWNAARGVLEQAGRLLVRKNGLLAELIETNRFNGVDREVAGRIVANWGERLIDMSRAASREAVASGKLADILTAASEHIDGTSAGRRFPMPWIYACQKTRTTVEASALDWCAISPTLANVLGADPYLFRKLDGKMVYDDLIPAFKDCTSWKSLVASGMSKVTPEDKRALLMAIGSISETLKKANDCTDKDTLGKTLDKIDFRFLFQGFADRLTAPARSSNPNAAVPRIGTGKTAQEHPCPGSPG